MGKLVGFIGLQLGRVNGFAPNLRFRRILTGSVDWYPKIEQLAEKSGSYGAYRCFQLTSFRWTVLGTFIVPFSLLSIFRLLSRSSVDETFSSMTINQWKKHQSQTLRNEISWIEGHIATFPMLFPRAKFARENSRKELELFWANAHDWEQSFSAAETQRQNNSRFEADSKCWSFLLWFNQFGLVNSRRSFWSELSPSASRYPI